MIRWAGLYTVHSEIWTWDFRHYMKCSEVSPGTGMTGRAESNTGTFKMPKYSVHPDFMNVEIEEEEE